MSDTNNVDKNGIINNVSNVGNPIGNNTLKYPDTKPNVEIPPPKTVCYTPVRQRRQLVNDKKNYFFNAILIPPLKIPSLVMLYGILLLTKLPMKFPPPYSLISPFTMQSVGVFHLT